MTTADVIVRAAKGAALKPPRVSIRTLAAVGCALALAVAGGLYLNAPKARETTDDAYLHADTTVVAPKVRGLISRILVADNQAVKAGDPLVQIDPEEFDARLAAAKADLETAQAAEAAARAALISHEAEVRLSAANVQAAQILIASADAQATRAAADQGRYDALAGTGAVTDSEIGGFRATAVTARADAAHSRAALAVSVNESAVVQAKRPTLIAALAQSKAGVARAEAALKLALQDQTHALIRAPISGVVGDRQAQVGDYVQPGARLMTLVPLNAIYVTANFKETQTQRMQVGQPAVIQVDALGGARLRGRVDSLAPGSGSEFSLLPFEPGTGNFTKVVQRVPVRIRLDPGQALLAQLRPGLSATATVDVRGR
jgi:membrane fusion protein (multidrug efflux system)